jgi:hypothetical protein
MVMWKMMAVVIGMGLASLLESAPRPHSFLSSGIFSAPGTRGLNLESIRMDPKRASEKITFLFSTSSSRKPTARIPPFHCRFMPATSPELGTDTGLKPARFILLLQGLSTRFLSPGRLTKVAEKSRLIEKLVLYPPLEDGDSAVEITFKKSVLFRQIDPDSLRFEFRANTG